MRVPVDRTEIERSQQEFGETVSSSATKRVVQIKVPQRAVGGPGPLDRRT